MEGLGCNGGMIYWSSSVVLRMRRLLAVTFQPLISMPAWPSFLGNSWYWQWTPEGGAERGSWWPLRLAAGWGWWRRFCGCIWLIVWSSDVGRNHRNDRNLGVLHSLHSRKWFLTKVYLEGFQLHSIKQTNSALLFDCICYCSYTIQCCKTKLTVSAV